LKVLKLQCEPWTWGLIIHVERYADISDHCCYNVNSKPLLW